MLREDMLRLPNQAAQHQRMLLKQLHNSQAGKFLESVTILKNYTPTFTYAPSATI